MKKKLIIVLIICLSLLVFHDFLIRQYFISKIEYVDYDEYILIDYLNGKKNRASYVGADFMIVLEYNADEEVELVTAYDYAKRVRYQYSELGDTINKDGNNEDRPINLNNDHLLNLLKRNSKFKYRGISKISSRECYILEFEIVDNITSIYVDKELLYTVKYIEKYPNNNVINDYELDLELKYKDLFENYIN